ncbi:hypothetical protein J3R75_001309 [Oligosphaera ethanolica]|uniref:Uncharacterized protein n=1 Tax=Oligosphaera ethanolica TaxID=760260 RepID=A0AAE4AN37_9BACT|nr:hypothetical protein [Oligosphaera ethanolica]MDQ0289202.1 hypothetical protein [Oligosphaera ethanolica]
MSVEADRQSSPKPAIQSRNEKVASTVRTNIKNLTKLKVQQEEGDTLP